ncbi:MAG: restriction endonuclease subunit S [bacterium]|nr:restriction endonuclease subunit S [bacterium]
MKKYDKYKDSGIEWIGEIPEYWEIATVGRISNLGRGRVISHIEIENNHGKYPVYSSQTENEGIMGFINTFDFEGEYVTWTTDGANAGTVFYREGKFNCTNVCGTIQPKNWNRVEVKYLPYYLNLGTKYSVRLDINPKLMNNMMSKIPIIIPPKTEQTAIANYLDDKTEKIDTLIEKKEKLIELYKEERTATINHAVTKGIDPDAKFKPSGIDWFGGIPEHWEIRRLATLGFFTKGMGISRSELIEQGLPAILYGDIYTKYNIKTSNIVNHISPETARGSKAINKGDILFTGSGETVEDIGKNIVYLGNHIVYVGGDIIIFTPSICDSLFLSYSLNSNFVIFQKARNARGEIIVHTYSSKLRDIVLPIPPIGEQNVIVKHIEKENQRIDATISEIQKEIELLKEYKTSLIYEVVTGKVKVI